MSAGGSPSNVKLGPGRLWIGPVGATAPTNASSAPDAAFWALGYTEEGTTMDIERTSENVEVAEELDPVAIVNTARSIVFNVSAAEMTKKRLAVALAAGADYVDNAAAFDFPEDSEPVGVAVIWDSEETAAGNSNNRRWYVPKMIAGGTTISIPRQKAPNKSLIPMALSAVKTDGNPIVRIFPNASGQI